MYSGGPGNESTGGRVASSDGGRRMTHLVPQKGPPPEAGGPGSQEHLSNPLQRAAGRGHVGLSQAINPRQFRGQEIMDRWY